MLTDEVNDRNLFEDAVQIVGTEDEQILAVDLDLLAAELAVDDLVADLHGNGNQVAVLIGLASADCQNDAALRLFLGLGCDEQTWKPWSPQLRRPSR